MLTIVVGTVETEEIFLVGFKTERSFVASGVTEAFGVDNDPVAVGLVNVAFNLLVVKVAKSGAGADVDPGDIVIFVIVPDNVKGAAF